MKPPGGEHRRPPTLGGPANLGSMPFLGRSLIFMFFFCALGVLGFLGILAKNLEKIIPEPSHMEPRGLKNRARGLQNRAWSPPRRHFLKTLNLRRVKRSYIGIFWGQKSQLGSILEAQDPPKSRPKPEKSDVEKQHIFQIDFGRVQASFWKGFWDVFLKKNRRKL